MKRQWRRPTGSISCVMLALGVSAAAFAAPPTANPLRSATPVEKSNISATVAATANRPVGTGASGTSAPGTSHVSAARHLAPAAPYRSKNMHRHPRGNGVVPAAYGQRVSRHPNLAPPPSLGLTETSVLQGTVTVEKQPGEIVSEEIFGQESMGEYVEGGECGDCGQCNECCFRLPCIPLDNLTVFGGVQGFTGPMNRGQSGSFGFHEGFNWGAPVPCMADCLSVQAGARFTQSNFSGAEFSPDSRDQVFVTAGLFRRVDCGLQFGLAIDYLSDDWYTETDLSQLRGEASWVFPCGHELGIWATSSNEEDTAISRVFTGPAAFVDITETWESTDLYAFFYRHRFAQWEGATARVFAGFSGTSDGLIGSDLHIPVGGDFALEAGFAYLVPEEDKGPVGAGNEEEAWNVFITLVWYPCSGRAMMRSYSNPLLNVADNGSFMVDRLR